MDKRFGFLSSQSNAIRVLPGYNGLIGGGLDLGLHDCSETIRNQVPDNGSGVGSIRESLHGNIIRQDIRGNAGLKYHFNRARTFYIFKRENIRSKGTEMSYSVYNYFFH